MVATQVENPLTQVRIRTDLRLKAKVAASETGTTLHKWFEAAVEEKLERDKAEEAQ